MKLEHRLAKLEAARCAEPDGPDLIIFRAVLDPGADGPSIVAMLLRGPGGVVHLERDEGETEAAFTHRAQAAGRQRESAGHQSAKGG